MYTLAQGAAPGTGRHVTSVTTEFKGMDLLGEKERQGMIRETSSPSY